MARIEPLVLNRPVRSAEPLPEPQRWRGRRRGGNRGNYGYNNYGGNRRQGSLIPGVSNDQLLALKVGVVKGLVLAKAINAFANNGK